MFRVYWLPLSGATGNIDCSFRFAGRMIAYVIRKPDIDADLMALAQAWKTRLIAGRRCSFPSEESKPRTMDSLKNPRYQGRISAWKDDQGFGFITPNGGGPNVFVHIKSFARQGVRPAGNEIVTYHLAINEKGQPRAENVAYVRNRDALQPSGRSGMSSLIAAVVFLGFVTTCTLTGKLPVLVSGLYLVMSVVAFIAYALDKSAARNNRWRTKESTLHALGFAGGWPGALFAQQIFRHKYKKQAFQQVFWFTVIANCIALGWLLSSSGFDARRILLGSP